MILVPLVLVVDQSMNLKSSFFDIKNNPFDLLSSSDMLPSGDDDRYDEDSKKY